MRKKLEVGIIGLGKFGLHLGMELVKLGHTVVGIDTNELRVKHAQDQLSRVYVGDATDIAVLDQLRFQDFSVVAVSVGESMEASILAAYNLQELGVEKIIVKAVSLEHRKVLKRLGIHKVIQPEVDVAIETAQRLANPGMLDLLPVGGGILIQEFVVNHWAGKTLADLDLMNKHGVLAVAVKTLDQTEFQFVPNATRAFAKGDCLVLIGKKDAVAAIES